MRYVLRSLQRAPVFALVAIGSVALGIGANVTVFSAINGLLLRPMPVAEPERLVRIGRATREGSFGTVSFLEYKDLRATLAPAAHVAAHFPSPAILRVGTEPRQVWLEIVSANYFSALGAPLTRGRGFVPEADDVDATEIVLSDALWRTRFSADTAIVGRAVSLNGHPFTVVGVAAPSFRGALTGFAIDAWVPARMVRFASPRTASIDGRDDRFLMLVARLRPAASVASVQPALRTAAMQLQRAQQDTSSVRLTVERATGVHPLVARIVGGFLVMLQLLVSLVLLIACTNLANVLLVRTASRRRDLALRVALGASPNAIVRLVLAECAVLALAGGVLGIALAFWLCRTIERIDFAVGIPVGLSLPIDARVVTVALLATAATALAFGLGPALGAGRADALAELRVGGATDDRRRSRVRNALVGAQVAVATVLLAASMLLLRSLGETSRVKLGFDPRGVETFAASPELLGYDEERGRALWKAIVERTRALPGVRDATVALWVPLGSRSDALSMSPAVGSVPPRFHPYNYVDDHYFGALKIPVVAGRSFLSGDVRGTPFVAVVSRAMAAAMFPGRTALGQQMRISDRGGNSRLVTIVGIAADVKLRTLGETPKPITYLPLGQWYRPDLVLHARTVDVATTRHIVAEIHQLEPNLAVSTESMDHAAEFALLPLRVASAVLGFAGAVGLALAAMGVFGLVAYAVSLRRREIGIRIALGARPSQLSRLVGTEGLRPVLVGMGVGVALSLLVGQALRGLLVGIGPTDPIAFGAVCLVLLASAALALAVPLRRALRVDPVAVLRAE